MRQHGYNFKCELSLYIHSSHQGKTYSKVNSDNINQVIIQLKFNIKFLPSLPSPCSIGSHYHFSALVALCVVHQQLQRFPLIGFNQRKEIL